MKADASILGWIEGGRASKPTIRGYNCGSEGYTEEVGGYPVPCGQQNPRTTCLTVLSQAGV